MKSWLLVGVIAAGFVACGTDAAIAGSASYTINITGYVPVVCRVTANATEVDTGSQVNLGSIAEFCNNPTGYQVWVDYAPGVTSATMSVDGATVPLSSSGSTMIDSSATAASLTRNLTLNGGQGLNAISFRVVPI
jgi:hypothetical protein